MRNIEKNISENVINGNIKYGIMDIEITNYTFIKNIFKEESNKNGTYTYNINIDELGRLNFSYSSTDPNCSAKDMYIKDINTIQEKDIAECEDLISKLQAFIIMGKFSGEAVKVFNCILEKYNNRVTRKK